LTQSKEGDVVDVVPALGEQFLVVAVGTIRTGGTSAQPTGSPRAGNGTNGPVGIP